MAIAFLQDGETFEPGTGTSITIAFDSGSTGSDRYLVVAIFGATTDKVTGVTYNGDAMTLLKKQVGTAQGGLYMYFFGLANPDTGTNNIVISASSSITQPPVWYGVYTGVDATQPDDDAYNNRGGGSGSFAVTLTTVADNCWLLAMEMDNNGAMAATADCVKRSGWSNGYGTQVFDSNSAKTPAGSNALTVTGANGGLQDLLGISLAPKSATVVTPSALATTAAVLAPTVIITDTVAPSAQALTLAVLAPSLKTSDSFAPSAQALTLAVQAPTVLSGKIITPSAIALTAAIPAPTVMRDWVFSVSALSLTSALLSTSYVLGTTVTPSALALSLTVQAPANRWNNRSKATTVWTIRAQA